MGLGDEIMAAGVAERMWRETGETVAIVDEAYRPRRHPVWERNPAIDPDGSLYLRDHPGFRGYMLCWADGPRAVFDRAYHNRDHPGRIYPPEHARAWARENVPEGCVIVEPIVRQPSSVNKDWGAARWSQVAALLTGVDVVQLGEDGGRTLIAPWIKTPTFWYAAAAIERARVVVTVEGGMHHMAGALGVPAVTIFGGFTHPQTTGYDTTVPFYVDGPDSPCGRYDSCSHCTEAHAAITPKMVVDAVYSVLQSAPCAPVS